MELSNSSKGGNHVDLGDNERLASLKEHGFKASDPRDPGLSRAKLLDSLTKSLVYGPAWHSSGSTCRLHWTAQMQEVQNGSKSRA